MPDREWQDRSDTDRREITERRQQWYTNKEIFEMVQELRDELQKTRDVVKKYNGIRHDLDWCVAKLQKNKNMREGQSILLLAFRDWLGWIVALVAIYLNLMG